MLLGSVAVFAQGIGTAGSSKPSPKDNCPELDAKALSQISEDWKAGYNQGDAARVAALYAEDAYYLTQHFATGIVQGRTEIQAYVKHGTDARYQLDSIQIVSLHCSGNFAYTITRYESSNAGQKAMGVNLVVLKKLNGKWRIVAHEAAVPDPSTAIPHLDVPGR